MTTTHQKTAVIDFDNTISGYDKWRGPDVLGPPIPYAIDAILEMKEWGWNVVVFTTRGNVESIEAWLRKEGFPPLPVNSTAHNPPNTSAKPIAEVYFDDRDAHVVGEMPYNWHAAMRRVRRLYRPWLDSYVDDAQAWDTWWIRWLVAPYVRKAFAASLSTILAMRQVAAEDMEDDVE